MLKQEWKNDPLKPTLIELVVSDTRYIIRKCDGYKEAIKVGLYLCRCGNTFKAEMKRINSGNTKSCGCIHKCKYPKHPLRATLNLMKARCYNSLNISYKNYGRKGIKICDRWLEPIKGLENFINDMGEKPSPAHSIDRIDNDEGYYPWNCRWATKTEQNRNYSRNVMLEYKRDQKLIVEWSEEKNIPYYILHNRIKAGWSTEKILETPVKVMKKRKVEYVEED